MKACGYHCGEDLSVIETLITRMMSDDNYLQACSRQAQKCVKEQMMPDVVTKEYMTVLNRVAKR